MKPKTTLKKSQILRSRFSPWVPMSVKKQILLKMDEVITAYETYPEIEQYTKLVEADGGRTTTTSSETNTITANVNLYLIGTVTELDEEPSLLIENCYEVLGDEEIVPFPKYSSQRDIFDI